MSWRFSALGDGALLAEADGDHERANRAALALAAALEADPPPGFVAAVPAIASLLVCFDPLRCAHAALEARLRALLAGPPAAQEGAGRLVELPARFGGDDGPDLEEAAAALGMAPAELVARLCAAPLRVMMIGFAPGYPYLGPLPAELHLPRRATPRAAVPAGSVAIAAGLAGVYPARLPGGWHLLGRTELRLFDPAADPPAALAPGDLVRIVPIAGGRP